MAGIGQPQPSVSVPQSPLVTPAVPTGQAAVDSMINAFRQGQLTSQDLVNHFGMKARAETQLGTAQAEAALPLVQPMAELSQAKTSQELATTNWGQASLKTAQETMGWYGDSMENYRDPITGRVDFQKLAKVGAQRVAELGQLDKWAQGLTKAETREITLANGTKKLQRINAYGEDVTPPDGVHDGSPRYWYYVDQMSKFMPKAHPYASIYPTKYISDLEPYPGEAHARGEVDAAPPTPEQKAKTLSAGGPFVRPAMTMPGGVPIPGAAAEVLPENPKLSEMRAALVNSGKPASLVTAMSPEQVVAATPVGDLVSAVTEKPTAAAPMIQPTPTLSHGRLPYAGGTDIVQTPQTVFTAEKVREDLMKEVPYQSWQKSVPYATTFELNADEVRKLTPAQQGKANMNMTDLGLAESLIKLYDPEGVIREFKWEKFETNQPRIDLLKNAWDLAVNRRGSFTPETRAKLIQMGEEVIAGREKAARPAIEKAFNQVKTNPSVDPSTVFTTEDQRLLAEKEVARTAAAGQPVPISGPVPPGAIIGNIPGIGRGYMVNGQFQLVK